MLGLINLFFFTGAQSGPDEDRLLKHLLDPSYQKNNLMTTPILHTNETVAVTVGIEIRKLVALVDHKDPFSLTSIQGALKSNPLRKIPYLCDCRIFSPN